MPSSRCLKRITRSERRVKSSWSSVSSVPSNPFTVFRCKLATTSRCLSYSSSALDSSIQFLTHPIGLLRPVLIRNVVADVIAILKHPQLCCAARFRCYALPLFCRHKPVAAPLNHQQRALYLLRYSPQIELLQFVECLLLVSSFEAVHHRLATYHRAVFEVGSLVIWTTVFNHRL